MNRIFFRGGNGISGVLYTVICPPKFPRELLQPAVIGKQVNADWWSRNLASIKRRGQST